MPCGCSMKSPNKKVKGKNSSKTKKRNNGIQRLLNMLRGVQSKTSRKGRV